MIHRAPTSAPAATDSTRDGLRANRPTLISAHRTADLIASPRLRGGWRADAGQRLRLVWRFDPAA